MLVVLLPWASFQSCGPSLVHCFPKPRSLLSNPRLPRFLYAPVIPFPPSFTKDLRDFSSNRPQDQCFEPGPPSLCLKVNVTDPVLSHSLTPGKDERHLHFSALWQMFSFGLQSSLLVFRHFPPSLVTQVCQCFQDINAFELVVLLLLFSYHDFIPAFQPRDLERTLFGLLPDTAFCFHQHLSKTLPPDFCLVALLFGLLFTFLATIISSVCESVPTTPESRSLFFHPVY